MINLLLLVRATYIWVLFFVHIPFVVNRTINTTPNGEVATTSAPFRLHVLFCEGCNSTTYPWLR